MTTTFRAVALMVIYAAAVAVLHARASNGVQEVEQIAQRGADVDGWVELAADPVPQSFRTRAVVRLGAQLDGQLDGALALAVAHRPESSALNVVGAGDRLWVRGRIVPLAELEARRWHHRHVGALLEIDDVLDVRSPRGFLARAANLVRGVVLAGTERMPSPEAGVVAGFLVGDTRAIPDGVIDSFRAAGLSHLLAVSGANVAFVLALVGPCLRRLGLRGRFAAALAVIALFAAATRFEPSVLRASAMAAVAALAAFLGRPASGMRVFGIGVGALVLVDPFLIHSVGFRLSCAACAGIILWSAPIARRLPGPEPLREALAVTIAAQVAVTPVLLPIFGSVPLASIPANALAVPLAGPLTMWGMASGAAASLLDGPLPEVSGLLQVPTLLLARAVAGIADRCAAIPWTVDATAAWGLLALGCAVAALRKSSRRLDPDADHRVATRAP